MIRNTSNTGADYTRQQTNITLELRWSVRQEPCVKLGPVYYVLTDEEENLSPFTRVGVRTVNAGTVTQNFMLPTTAFAEFNESALKNTVNLLDGVLRTVGLLGSCGLLHRPTICPLLTRVLLEVLERSDCSDIDVGDWFYDFGSGVLGIAVSKYDPKQEDSAGCIDFIDLDSKHLPQTRSVLDAVNLNSIGFEETAMTMLDMLGVVTFPVFDNQRRIITDRFNSYQRELKALEAQAENPALLASSDTDNDAVIRASILLLHRITGQVRTRLLTKAAPVNHTTPNFMALLADAGALKLKKDALESISAEISKELHSLLSSHKDGI
jgi:hypothetical protein